VGPDFDFDLDLNFPDLTTSLLVSIVSVCSSVRLFVPSFLRTYTAIQLPPPRELY